MVNFTMADDNIQFISIISAENTKKILDTINTTYPQTTNQLHGVDSEQIVLKIPDYGFGFSLNDLKSAIAEAKIEYLAISFDSF